MACRKLATYTAYEPYKPVAWSYDGNQVLMVEQKNHQSHEMVRMAQWSHAGGTARYASPERGPEKNQQCYGAYARARTSRSTQKGEANRNLSVVRRAQKSSRAEALVRLGVW